MTNHLPECSAATIEDLLDGFPDMHPSNRVYLEGEVCICDALRACEQRMFRESVRAGSAAYDGGYAAGVRAARDAVADCRVPWPTATGDLVNEGIDAALAAIDALGGSDG